MSELWAFKPITGSVLGSTNGGFQNSLTVAATTSSQSNPLPGNLAGGQIENTIQIANQSASWAYVNMGLTGVAATTNGYPVGPGAVVLISIPGAWNAVAVLLASGTGNVTFTRGLGL